MAVSLNKGITRIKGSLRLVLHRQGAVAKLYRSPCPRIATPATLTVGLCSHLILRLRPESEVHVRFAVGSRSPRGELRAGSNVTFLRLRRRLSLSQPVI